MHVKSFESYSLYPLDKGHVPENLWKLSVTYLFHDTHFPIGGLYIAWMKEYAWLAVHLKQDV